MTIVLRSRAELREWRLAQTPHATIGFVPTMGALHAGHLSLVRAAREQNDVSIASIFVNPLQFGPSEDFERYPGTFEADLAMLREAGTDAVFAPAVAEMYPPGASTLVQEGFVTGPLCGSFRPRHFDGVTTVVLKLLNLVKPEWLYLGQKDAQQCAVLRRMVRDLDVPVQVITCPTIREADGLAMSSRNTYLGATDRALAPLLYRSLLLVEDEFKRGQRQVASLLAAARGLLAPHPEIRLQYFEIRDPDTLAPLERVEGSALVAVAAFLGATRLIDNVTLS